MSQRNNIYAHLYLINTTENIKKETLEKQMCANDIKIYPTDDNYDLVAICTGDIFSQHKAISNIPGIVSSRALALTKVSQNQAQENKNYGLITLDLSIRNENSIDEKLKEVDEGYAIATTKGIHDRVLFVSYDDENKIKNKINTVKGIRHATFIHINNPITIPTKPILPVLSGRHTYGTNKYEGENYIYSKEIFADYARASMNMAQKFQELIVQEQFHPIIYAPIRGAKPIVDTMMECFRKISPDSDLFFPKIYYPVTSSFVLYPDTQPFLSKKEKKPTSGRLTNVLELTRLKQKKLIKKDILYIDEIVSGGMITGHTKEMLCGYKRRCVVEGGEQQLVHGILREEVESGEHKVAVFGLADSHGKRFIRKGSFKAWMKQGLLQFFEFPTESLVTEDQRYLLGIHYTSNELGPHCIPLIQEDAEYFKEREQMIEDFKTTIYG